MADTGGIVAAMDPDEPDHLRARATLDDARAAYITPLVIAEVHYLLSAAGEHRAARDFLGEVADGFYTLTHPEPDDYATARDLIRQYEGTMVRKRRKPGSLDLADAMNVVVARDLETPYLVAIDHDYRQVRPLSAHDHFVLLPADQR